MSKTAAVTGRLAPEEMRDCEACGTPCYTKTCFRCSIPQPALAVEPAATAEPPRIVIAMKKGVVTSVYLSDGPVAHSEVLIADEDAFDMWAQGESYPKAAVMPSLPLEALNDVREIANMVLAFEGEDVSCTQCGDEFKPDDVIDGEFCTAACSDRHYRM